MPPVGGGVLGAVATGVIGLLRCFKMAVGVLKAGDRLISKMLPVCFVFGTEATGMLGSAEAR